MRRNNGGERDVVILRKRVVGLTEAALRQFVARAARAVGLQGAVNVLVTSSADLRALNQRFRGQERATDVLSFPPVAGLNDDFAGDIAISADIAAQNARRLGHAPAQEIKILTLHGLLHLAGYDHERDRGEMSRKEQRLRRAMRLPAGLIARSEAAERESSTMRRSERSGRSGGLRARSRATGRRKS